MRQRLHYIDVAKGMLILMVIATHIDGMTSDDGLSTDSLWTIGGGIRYCWGCFFMQAFFVLNGFTSHFDKPFSSFLKSNIRTLLVPCIFFSVLTKLLTGIVYDEWSLYTVTGDERRIWLDETYWFLEALFLARIVFWLTLKYIGKAWQRWTTMFLLLIAGVWLNHLMDGKTTIPSDFANYFHYRNAMCMTIFIGLGHWLKKHKTLVEPYYSYAFIVYLIAMSTAWYLGYQGVIPVYNHTCGMTFKQIPVYLMFATLGTFATVWISKMINHSDLLEYFGKGSIVVYTMHFFCLRVIVTVLKPFFTLTTIVETAFYFLLVFVLTALTCAVAIYIFQFPYLRRVLGK